MTVTYSRREALRGMAAVGVSCGLPRMGTAEGSGAEPLAEFGYGDVVLKSERHLAQLENVRGVLMGLSDDSLMMPFRQTAGKAAPGVNIGGWYEYRADYDYRKDDAGLATGGTFGQWVSALARMYAVSGDEALRERVVRLNGLLGETISRDFFAMNRFPAYCFDKLVCGLMDGHRLAKDEGAAGVLARCMDVATPELPGRAVEREVAWRPGKDVSYAWDESYTLPENLYLVSAQMGADGAIYGKMAGQYLDDAAYFDPLARGENVLGGRHAYSYVNALCSAMQAYMVGGSEKHLRAAKNGFDFLEQQSFATGGWGPDELLRKPGSGEVFASLTKTHNSFETPCGAYAHMKLTRYLLRCTRDGRYGDSMERVMYNTVLGAMPMEADGRAFYYSDYAMSGSLPARRVYSEHRWPCCSGTLPQVVADYWINGFFREPGAVWVNLYVPSRLRWKEGGANVEMELGGGYPADGTVKLKMASIAGDGVEFGLNLRVPAWTDGGAEVKVNGTRVDAKVVKGFCSLKRRWKAGDVVEMVLPMRVRLAPVTPEGAAAHPEVVAMMVGPRVMFALGEVVATRAQVMAARQISGEEWRIETAKGAVRMVPFTGIGDAAYSAYLRLMGA